MIMLRNRVNKYIHFYELSLILYELFPWTFNIHKDNETTLYITMFIRKIRSDSV